MKILMITPYVTIAGKTEFEKNKTGFGYMVHDIAKAIAITEQVDVLATDSRGETFEAEGVHYLQRSILTIVKNVFRSLNYGIIRSMYKKYPLSHGAKTRLWYYWAMTGYLNRLLEKNHYDVVHIHGCTSANELWMAVCSKCSVKYLVTLHGLNSFSNTTTLEISGKQYERDFLKKVVDGEIQISVISTGMKRQIEGYYGVNGCTSIAVVCNSFNLEANKPIAVSAKRKYNIPDDAKVLLCVGNITKNKNQIQLVRAFGLLPKGLQEHTYVLFCGKPDMSCGVEGEIAKQSLASHLILCGVVDKAELPAYYTEADCIVMLSFAEGFGLSLIEGMHFGKPCVAFVDLASFEDIYDPCGVVGILNREDKDVASALEKCLTLKWDENEIIRYSRKFNKEYMANKYISMYKDLLNR